MSQPNGIKINNNLLETFYKNVSSKTYSFDFNLNLKSVQNDKVELTTNIAEEQRELENEFNKTKQQQGLTGKLWDGFKNLAHFKSGSDYVEKSIKDFNQGKITKEQAQEILTKYQDGQNICVDTVADIASGIAAVGIFSFAASGVGIPIALGLSFLTGATIKAGGKCFGAKTNGREYDGKNLLYDIATGGINGLLAPVTNGLGSNLTKTIGAKLGLEIVGDTVEAGAKTTLKSILLNQSIDVTGGNVAKRALALGAGMALDGALGGSADNATRATLEGKNSTQIVEAGFQGFIGGLIMSPIIGGGFRIAGKLGKKIGEKVFKNKTPKTPNDAKLNDVALNPTQQNRVETASTRNLVPDTKANVSVNEDLHANSVLEAKPETNPNIKPCLQAPDVQKTRLDELVLINSNRDVFNKLSTEFMERASKEFSPDRYALFVELNNCLDCSEYNKHFVSYVAHVVNNCPEENIGIFRDLVKFANPDNVKHEMSYTSFKDALSLNKSQLLCLRDILQNQNDECCLYPSMLINALNGLTDEQLQVFKKFVHIDGLKSYNQLQIKDVRELAMNFPADNVEYAKKALSAKKFSASSILENFAGCSKERAAVLLQMYECLSGDAGKRIFFSDLGNFLIEASDNELALATKLLSAKKADGDYIFSGHYGSAWIQNEPLLPLFFENHSEAKFTLFDEILKYQTKLNANDISCILKYFDDEQAEFVKRILYIEGRSEKSQFYCDSFFNLSHIKKDKIDFIENSGLLYMPERKSQQFDALELARLCQLDNDLLEVAKRRRLFVTKKINKEYLNALDIVALAQVDEKDWPKAVLLIDSQKKNGLSASGIAKLAKLNDAEFKIAKQILFLDNTAKFNADSIMELVKLDPDKLQTAKQRGLLSISRFNGKDIAELASLSDAQYDKIKPFVAGEYSKRNFNGVSIKKLVESLSDEEFDRAKELVFALKRDENLGYKWYQFNADQIIELCKLPKEIYEKVKFFFNIDTKRRFQFDKDQIVELAQLTGRQLDVAQSLVYIPQRNRFEQFSCNEIVLLSKLAPSELEKAKKYFYIKDIEGVQLCASAIALLTKYENIKSIESLTISQKRELLKDLIRENTNLFYLQQNSYAKIANSGVIPSNQKEYCAILPKLVKSIGISTNELADDVKTGFYGALDSIEKPNSAFRKFDFEQKGLRLDLKYPRVKFISDILDILKPLTKEERKIVCNYFGFEINLKDGKDVLNGYPVSLNNGAELAKIDNPRLKEIIAKMRPLVRDFSENNAFFIKGEPQLTSELNAIIRAFPELITEIGKKQHITHDYTLDIHTLRVLQGVINNPKYNNLPDNDKLALKIAALLHDITKQENLIDATHPSESAFDAYYLLQKLNLAEDEKLKIYQIIKDHDWLQRYNSQPYMRKEIAQDIAFDLRMGNSFEMASMLTEADMKAVKRNGKFFEGYRDILEQGEKEISDFVKQIKESAIHLPQTKIPKASEIIVDGEHVQDVVTKLADGTQITNRVIYLEPNMDLSKYGFENELNSNDLNLLIHALDNEKASAIFQALGQIDSDALLSTSYVNYEQQNYRGFRNQGFVLDVESDDINAGYYKDFGSGYEKNLDGLKKHYLFDGTNKRYRTYISDELKKLLGINDKQYVELYEQIKNKTILELDKHYPEVAKAMRVLFKRMEGGKRANNREYNEILISRPKIQAVFDYGRQSDISNIPEYLRQYAADNNLPIIYFGK